MRTALGRMALIFAVVLAVAATGLSENAAAQRRQEYVMVSGGAGGSWYLLMGAIAELMMQNMPNTVAHVEPGGAVINVQLVNNVRDADFGLSLTSTSYEAWHGVGEFEGRKLTNIRSVAVMFPFVYQTIALEQSGIREFEDLRGKRYTPSFPGQTSYILSQQLLEVHGLTLDDTQARPQGWSEAHDALKDLQIDALSWSTTAPQPTFLELSMARPVRLIGFRPEKIDEFLARYPMYSRYTITAGTYPFQDEDVYTISSVTDLVVNKDVPEEVVYQLTKLIYERKESLLQVHVGLDYISEENALADLTIPLHPGAARYYREKGFDIPERLLPVD